MEVIQAHLYDHPKYYDLVFGSDWKAEFDFLEGCFDIHTTRVVRRLFEPACGTGRLLYRFGAVGYDVGGNDLNPHAVEYCNRRLESKGIPGRAQVGDMSRFRLPRKVDAAFNTINSFRHLQTEQQAYDHLQCMANCLSRGGVYVLGFHLTPQSPRHGDEEWWTARRGHLTINSRLWSIEIDLRNREERVGMTYDIYTPTRQFRLEDETIFRTYTAEQFDTLLKGVPELEVAATYDFAYELDCPIQVDRRTEDVIFVLRKR
jgi:SAM-dependent methyltransferase